METNQNLSPTAGYPASAEEATAARDAIVGGAGVQGQRAAAAVAPPQTQQSPVVEVLDDGKKTNVEDAAETQAPSASDLAESVSGGGTSVAASGAEGQYWWGRGSAKSAFARGYLTECIC